MRNTQERSCYGTVSDQTHHMLLPSLIRETDSTVAPTAAEDDAKRSLRLFGREGVLVSICGGPCARKDVIEMAFAGA